MQTRTPPHIKWLLNERAALAGELERIQSAIPQLESRQAKLIKQLQKCTQHLESRRQRQPEAAARIEALERTILMFDDRVAPTAGGVIHAWADRYGKRGAQIDFVVSCLKQAGSGTLSTTELTNRAVAKFGLIFEFPIDRRSFGQRIASICRNLRNEGRIEQIKGLRKSDMGSWRWGKRLPVGAD